MTYVPTERLNISWATRNRTWRHMAEESRRRVTDIPAKFRTLTLDDLPGNTEGKVVRRWAERWGRYPDVGLDPADDDGRGLGLLLLGPPGRGKTRAASIAANHISDLGWSTKFISVANLYDLSIAVMREKDDEQREALEFALSSYEYWEGFRCLVLDDLGKEHKTASRWAEDYLDRMIRTRYTDGAPTIVTSNYSLDDIGRVYGESMESYVHEAFWIVECDGKDWRKR